MSKQIFKSNKVGVTMRTILITMILSLIYSSVTFADGGGRYKEKGAWSFGVHGDTQWTVSGNSEDNPNTVSAALARVVAAELRNKGVKFVIQTGDLTDYAGADSLATRASVARDTYYDFGIGFFPLRGNHETYGYLMNWDPLVNLNVPDFKTNFPQTQGEGPNLFGANNFSWPLATGDTLNIMKGLSYSFDYGKPGSNARFVMVDTEQTAAVPKRAPNDTDNVTAAQTQCNASIIGITVSGVTYGGAPEGTKCGQGYFYILHDWVEGGYKTGLTIYQAAAPITGITTNYNSAGTATGTAVITIPAGGWFRIDSSNRPSTNFYAWDMANPTQTYNGAPFDINYPTNDPDNHVLIQISSSGTEYFPGKQQAWISERLENVIQPRGTEHAFVFSHRPVINGNHTDSFFGASSAATTAATIAEQNNFFASLQNNGVKFMISGHDHLYNRALDKSPDGSSQIMQIITQGISTKFYSPTSLDAFGKDGIVTTPQTIPLTFVKDREMQISQEVNNFGYYVYTVDGPRVTVDYYSDSFGGFKDGNYYPHGIPDDPKTPVNEEVLGSLEVPSDDNPPAFDFIKQDEWGYSLNGKQYLVTQGGSYTDITDEFTGTTGTTAKILSGINNSTTKDLTPYAEGQVPLYDENGPVFEPVLDKDGNPTYDKDNKPIVKHATVNRVVSDARKLTKVVNTGWVARPNYKALPVVKTFWDILKLFQALMINAQNKVQSDVMSIWGMSELGVEETDTYVLSMSYDTTSMYYGMNNMMMIKNGKAGIATYVNGKWVNAIDENFGGTKKFVLGKYDSTKNYPLGTYGIDLKTNTAWAVLNYNADFAVATNVGPACFKK
jgi:hypothetical protein